MQSSPAPPIRGKDAQKTLLAILCVAAVIYALVTVVISAGWTAPSAALVFAIFGMNGFKLFAGRNLYKWEYGLIMTFSIYAVIANIVMVIPNYLDLIIYEDWRVTILLEPAIASICFVIAAGLCYNLAFTKNAPFKSWTS